MQAKILTNIVNTQPEIILVKNINITLILRSPANCTSRQVALKLPTRTRTFNQGFTP